MVAEDPVMNCGGMVKCRCVEAADVPTPPQRSSASNQTTPGIVATTPNSMRVADPASLGGQESTENRGISN
eukprot:3158694-Amphidinium_carterae.1